MPAIDQGYGYECSRIMIFGMLNNGWPMNYPNAQSCLKTIGLRATISTRAAERSWSNMFCGALQNMNS